MKFNHLSGAPLLHSEDCFFPPDSSAIQKHPQRNIYTHTSTHRNTSCPNSMPTAPYSWPVAV